MAVVSVATDQTPSGKITHTHTHAQSQTTHHRPGFVQKPNYLTLLTSIFFLFHQQFFFLNSSSLSTNRKQTVYNRSNPYSTKHSQGKNEHFRFSSPSSPPHRCLQHRGRSWASACAWAAWRPPLLSEGWSFSDGWGENLCCFSSFRRTTSCRCYYGSTVVTMVLPWIHTLGQQAVCSLGWWQISRMNPF